MICHLQVGRINKVLVLPSMGELSVSARGEKLLASKRWLQGARVRTKHCPILFLFTLRYKVVGSCHKLLSDLSSLCRNKLWWQLEKYYPKAVRSRSTP